MKTYAVKGVIQTDIDVETACVGAMLATNSVTEHGLDLNPDKDQKMIVDIMRQMDEAGDQPAAVCKKMNEDIGFLIDYGPDQLAHNCIANPAFAFMLLNFALIGVHSMTHYLHEEMK